MGSGRMRVLLNRYWGIITVPGSFLFRGPGVASGARRLRACQSPSTAAAAHPVLHCFPEGEED